ncbi:uncharacterized protein BDZ99DRAFT_15871 [Mytilinidion resinicola]|uniref:Uncharacterized protein n=1 Tax=Mytilinidion resinicola TaxID=574789 RepID=A0A6A6Z8I3_9PEZI|nr:uncharacterized protein BDZ99DRAFT_15871 [Mytilinidion resinicola]KAF2817432.1 hypothetical protein BDZ99DRAFT_15871 [Mytilinidion resinicola]
MISAAGIKTLGSWALGMPSKAHLFIRQLQPNCFKSCLPICRDFSVSVSHPWPTGDESEQRAPRPCPSPEWQPRKSKGGEYDTSVSQVYKRQIVRPDGSAQHCPDCRRLFNDCPKHTNLKSGRVTSKRFDPDRDAWLCLTCVDHFYDRYVKYVLAKPTEASTEFVQHLLERKD